MDLCQEVDSIPSSHSLLYVEWLDEQVSVVAESGGALSPERGLGDVSPSAYGGLRGNPFPSCHFTMGSGLESVIIVQQPSKTSTTKTAMLSVV